MSIAEVLVYRYGLTWGGDDDGKVNGGRVDGKGTSSSWGAFPVRVDVAESRLVGREGGTVSIWCGGAIDDSCGVTVQGVGGGVEGVEEVAGLVCLSSGESGSFEAGWEGRQRAIIVEVLEEIGPY